MNFIQNSKLWFVVIVIYPWLFIWQGFDMTDSGYNISQFSDFFVNLHRHGTPLWLSNLLGGIWNECFGWMGYVGFKIGYIFTVYTLLFISWIMLKPFDKSHILNFVLFITTIFVLKEGGSWISYNSFSALFFMVIVFLIYTAFKTGNNFLYFLAGLVAGLNIFIRFPNLLDIFMIFALLIVMWNQKMKFLKILYIYFIGYLLAIATALLVMLFLGQFENYIESIVNLLNMSSNPYGSYGGGILLKLFIFDYTAVLIFFVISLVFIRYFVPFIARQNYFVRLSVIFALSLLSVLLFPIFDMWKYIYIVVLYFGILCIITDNNSSKDFKLLAILSFLFIFLVPLGSDNGIRNMTHGLWLIMPLVLLYFSLQKELYLYKWRIAKYRSFLWIKQLFIIITAVYSLLIGYTYTYRDSNDRLAMVYSINNDKLIGTYTTEKRAKLIEELLQELEVRLKDRDMFVYEKISILYYLMNKSNLMSDPWAVNQMIPNHFAKEFQDIASKKLPLMVRTRYSVSTFKWPYDKEKLSQSLFEQQNRIEVEKFIKKYSYKVVWSNEYFEILDKNNAK